MKGQGRLSLSVGWITLFLMGTDLFVVSPLLPFISQAYKISSATAGWMVTVFAITYAISAPFFGWLSDKKGRRSLITLGLLLFAASNILTACAPSFLWLIVSRILAGFFSSFHYPFNIRYHWRYRTTKSKGNMAFNRCFWSLNSPLGWNTTQVHCWNIFSVGVLYLL